MSPPKPELGTGTGSIAAGVFTFLSRGMDIGLLRKLFGGLLLLTGVRELLYKPRKR